MEEALVDELLAATALAVLVGDRITWDERPQASALPSVTLNLIDGVPEFSDEGFAGLTASRVQIDCWARSKAGEHGGTVAKRVAREVQAALDVEFTRNGVAFSGVFPESIRDYDPELMAGGVQIFRRSIDFLIWHNA